MPATPMKEAAERYSPEMAEAFQPTETERPATKKSPALLDLPAVQKPMPTVMTTVTSEQTAIQGSMPWAARRAFMLFGQAVLSGLGFGVLERDGALDEDIRDDPDEGEEEDAEDQPREGEPEDALGHERRLIIVQQGQGDERHREAQGAGDRELELVAHQARQEGIRMDGFRGGGGLAHGVGGSPWNYRTTATRGFPLALD